MATRANPGDLARMRIEYLRSCQMVDMEHSRNRWTQAAELPKWAARKSSFYNWLGDRAAGRVRRTCSGVGKVVAETDGKAYLRFLGNPQTIANNGSAKRGKGLING